MFRKMLKNWRHLRQLGSSVIVATLLLVCGCVVYSLFKVGIVVGPILERAAPVELDDAYSYMLFAYRAFICPFVQCGALSDLATQVNNYAFDFSHWHRVQGLVDVVGYQLYLLILVVVRYGFGLGWDTSFNLISIVGAAFLGFSLVYFFTKIWGRAAAGISMVVVGVIVLPAQGLNTIVPGNLALGVFLISFTNLVNASYFSAKQWVLIGLLLVMLHPVGLVFYGILVMYYLSTSGIREGRRGVIRILGLTSVAPLLYFFTKGLYGRETDGASAVSLSFDADTLFVQLKYAKGVIRQASRNFGFHQIQLYGGWFFLVALAGLFVRNTKRETQAGTALLIIALIATISLLYSGSKHSGTLFAKIWAPLFIFVTGFFGAAVFAWLVAIKKTASNTMRLLFSTRRWGSRDFVNPTILILAILFPAGLSYSFFALEDSKGRNTIERGVLSYKWAYSQRLNKRRYYFYSDQLDTVNKAQDSLVLYDSLQLLQFALLNGAINKPTLYGPLRWDLDNLDSWSEANRKIKYFIDWSPTEKMRIAKDGGISIPVVGTVVTYPVSADIPLLFINGEVVLFIENRKRKSKYLYYSINKSGSVKLRVAGKSKRWYKIYPSKHIEAEDKDESGSFDLYLWAEDGGLLLSGLRVADSIGMEADALMWPWNKGITMKYKGPPFSKRYLFGKPDVEKINFSTNKISKKYDRTVKILDDRGSSVLFEFTD